MVFVRNLSFLHDHLLGPRACVQVPSGDDHGRALPGQRQRHLQADPGVAPGDQVGPAAEVVPGGGEPPPDEEGLVGAHQGQAGQAGGGDGGRSGAQRGEGVKRHDEGGGQGGGGGGNFVCFRLVKCLG